MLNPLRGRNPFYLFILFFLSIILSGCGGGGVSNQNSPISVQPKTADVFAGNPVVFSISGGRSPYSVFSSNQSAIPLASNSVSGNSFVVNPNPVGADTAVTITAQDANGAIGTSLVTVKPALINLTVTPDPAAPGPGCAPAVCSGETASATVQTIGPSRTVRFDVVQGDYLFTSGPGGTTLSSSIPVTTDLNGFATVKLKANVGAPTQVAIIKATDVGTGAFLQTAFTIAQFTSGTGTLSVIPANMVITTTVPKSCTSGVQIFYSIFGGTPPYRIVSSSTQGAVVSPSMVTTNGGGFTATTVGALCGVTTFAITDATGRTTSATLDNQLNDDDPVPPPAAPALTVSPAAQTASACPGKTFNFAIAGGTPNYAVSSSNPSVATVSPVQNTSGQYFFTATGMGAGETTFTVTDSGGKSAAAKLTCT